MSPHILLRVLLALVLSACTSGPLETPAPSDEPAPSADVPGDPVGEPAPTPTSPRDPSLLIPSNASDLGALEETGITVDFASARFDTAVDCHDSSILGDCELVALPTDRPNACVCRADDVRIGDLEVVGDAALAIFARHSVTVWGTLSVAAQSTSDGPGLGYIYQDAEDTLGGRGGSHASRGGNNGAESHGNAAIVPLIGGMRGQDACGSRGGGGGGALQISAGETIDVTGTISAGGGGGEGGGPDGCAAGAGGGSGGAVLLEAVHVEVTGAVVANGGGGGGGGDQDGVAGGDGFDAHVQRALGGQGRDGSGCALGGYTVGGDGGPGSLDLENGGDGIGGSAVYDCFYVAFVGAGGGGGGAGRIRVNTQTGCACTGQFSPAPSYGDVSL